MFGKNKASMEEHWDKVTVQTCTSGPHLSIKPLHQCFQSHFPIRFMVQECDHAPLQCILLYLQSKTSHEQFRFTVLTTSCPCFQQYNSLHL